MGYKNILVGWKIIKLHKSCACIIAGHLIETVYLMFYQMPCILQKAQAGNIIGHISL